MSQVRSRYLLLTAFLLVTAITLIVVFQFIDQRGPLAEMPAGSLLPLPTPREESEMSLEAALRARRSARDYSEEPMTLAQVAQLLWAAQGITHPNGYRTAPSAGALYPLEIYLLAGNVDGLSPGVYRYIPAEHALFPVRQGDLRAELHRAALSQEAVSRAAVVIIIAAVFERTQVKYGERGIQYVHMEVGHAAQNVYLQAAALDLGTVFIGAFYEDQVKAVVGLAADEAPLGLMPVGRK
jgi:SagB-type dehydrogenase family enzyme